MAERRMFAKSIVLSDAFLDMPMSARCLYFTLGMFADDDGFVNSPKSLMRQCGASNDDLNVLLAKKFLIAFDTGLIVIKHWRINNYLRSDRYRETTYCEEKKQLQIEENGAYKLDGIPMVDQRYTNGIPSIGKDSIGKDSIGKDRVGKGSIDIPTIGEVIDSMPTLADITDYINSKNYTIQPQRFLEYYTTGGRTFPKSWKTVIDKWAKSEFKRSAPKHTTFDTTRTAVPKTPAKGDFGTDYLFGEKS